MKTAVSLAGLRWRGLAFEALSVAELYRLLRLRAQVFVVEQACAFQDLDGLDEQAIHWMGETTHEQGHTSLLAYTRLSPAGTAFHEASIGRVVISPLARGTGLGHTLMRESIAELHRRWGVQAIRIGAQAHLASFYQQHGFVSDNKPYVEDGIDHIEMVRA